MANYQDYERGYPPKYDEYQSARGGIGILVALGILAAIVIALVMLSSPNTEGLRDTASTPAPAAPVENNATGEEAPAPAPQPSQ